MKEIKTLNGKTILVDDEDYEYLSQWNWCVKTPHKVSYAFRCVYMGNRKKKHLFMHRVIMNTPPDLYVDHIDHNGLNNQKSNLRNCTRDQNNCNRLSFCKLGLLGVSYYRKPKNKKKPYRATIWSNGESFHLGCFATVEEAALAYNEAAIKYHGEFANLNKIG